MKKEQRSAYLFKVRGGYVDTKSYCSICLFPILEIGLSPEDKLLKNNQSFSCISKDKNILYILYKFLINLYIYAYNLA